MKFDIIGKTIKKGETIYGLIGIYSDSYDSIEVKYNNDSLITLDSNN